MNRKKGAFPFLAVLALVAGILACETSTVTNLFASPTPTSTDTPTPTPTFTPTPTPTVTPTPTPTPTPVPTGVETQKQSDGSTLFTDYDNKYQLTLPEGWVVIPLTMEDFAAFAEQMAKENPQLADDLNALKDMNFDPDMFRGYALLADRNFITDNFITNLGITVLSDPTLASMPLSFVTGMIESQLRQNGNKILTQGVNEIENPNGVEAEYIDIEQIISLFGKKLTVNSRIVLFIKDDKLIMFQVTTPKQFMNELFPIANEIGGTIEYIK